MHNDLHRTRPEGHEPPADPVAAAAHANPYPYYGSLLDGPPLLWHAGLGMWVACRADAIEAVLRCPALRVRPPAERVPSHLQGGPAGELFGQLVRMNDGDTHRRGKGVLQHALADVKAADLRARARRLARDRKATSLDEALFQLPVQVMGHALGLAPSAGEDVVAWVRAFVAGWPPSANASQLEASHAGATALMATLQPLAEGAALTDANVLATVLAHNASGALHGKGLTANLAGLLSQTCEATAGLVGNTIVALARQRREQAPCPALFNADAADNEWSAFVAEVARHDAPVQNTRRFVAEDVQMLGVRLSRGQCVLLVLAAANRDPAFNDRPDVFEPQRPVRRLMGFGHGPHQCPGQVLAVELAAGCVEGLLDAGLDPGTIDAQTVRYRPLPHARIPVFGF